MFHSPSSRLEREREKTPEGPLIVRERALLETRQRDVSLAVEPFGEREKRQRQHARA
jgi:hypothetical protein